MKNGLGRPAIERIALALKNTWSDFPRKQFIQEAEKGIEPLELKGRVQHLIAALHQYLPADFEKAANILVDMKNHWDHGNPNDNLAGFAAWPIIDYIGEYGLEYPEISLHALKQLTSLFSAEFAIRPFFIHHTDLTLKTVGDWCTDPDEHVRRLVSEGSRPRLPWGSRLPEFIKDPAPVFNLLEKLKDDPSAYVRRSVANNLNDISKDHPEMVIKIFRQWKKGAGKNREWMIRHATRSLVKAGHPEVFGLLGYTGNPELNCTMLTVCPKEIRLGESIELTCRLQSMSTRPQTVVMDYAVHHMKANGRTAPKVFKLRTLKIAPGQTVECIKTHAFKPITTRKYYPGKHRIEILINGKTFGCAGFTLRSS